MCSGGNVPERAQVAEEAAPDRSLQKTWLMMKLRRHHWDVRSFKELSQQVMQQQRRLRRVPLAALMAD